MERHRRYASVSLHTAALVLLCAALPASAQAVRNLPGFNTNVLAANDDSSTGAVPTGMTLNFFGVNTTTVFVNNNGNVTFNSALSQYTPNGLAQGVGQPIIAPFFADVDTRGAGSGVVHYGTDIVGGRHAFGVEWPAIGYHSSHSDKIATFQLVLIDRSDTGLGNFDIEFNYNTVQWETGDASGGSGGLGGTSAAVGYSNSGTPTPTYFQLPGSLVN